MAPSLYVPRFPWKITSTSGALVETSLSLPGWHTAFMDTALFILANHSIVCTCPGKFSGYSFQIGAATTVAQKGIPDHLIKTIGRLHSEAYSLNVHTPVDTILSVAGRLALKVVSYVYHRSIVLALTRMSLDFGHCLHWSFSHEILFSGSGARAQRCSCLVWGLMAGLPGFASHESGLLLGAGC